MKTFIYALKYYAGLIRAIYTEKKTSYKMILYPADERENKITEHAEFFLSNLMWKFVITSKR